LQRRGRDSRRLWWRGWRGWWRRAQGRRRSRRQFQRRIAHGGEFQRSPGIGQRLPTVRWFGGRELVPGRERGQRGKWRQRRKGLLGRGPLRGRRGFGIAGHTRRFHASRGVRIRGARPPGKWCSGFHGQRRSRGCLFRRRRKKCGHRRQRNLQRGRRRQHFTRGHKARPIGCWLICLKRGHRCLDRLLGGELDGGCRRPDSDLRGALFARRCSRWRRLSPSKFGLHRARHGHWRRAHIGQRHIGQQCSGRGGEQMGRRIKNFLALAATNPPLGDAQLVRHHLESGRTGRAAGDLAHQRRIVGLCALPSERDRG
jgi:hypothetical protein